MENVEQNNTVTRSVSTKPERNGQAVVTKLTIDWTGCTTDMYRAYAEAGLIIKLQSGWRRAAAGESPVVIPTELTVLASEHAPGVRTARAARGDVTPAGIQAAVASGKLSMDELRALIVQMEQIS